LIFCLWVFCDHHSLTFVAMSASEPGMNVGTCAICLDSLDIPARGCQKLTCGHNLHEDCIREWRRHSIAGTCPLCRSELEDLAPVEQLYEQAVLFKMRGSYEEAFQKLSEVLDLEPDHVNACCTMADIFDTKLEDDSKAAIWYEKAIGLGAKDLQNNLGQVYKRLGRKQDAESMFLLAAGSGSATALFNLAVDSQNSGNLSRAEELYWKAHQCGNIAATYNLANLKWRSGDMQTSEMLYLSIIENSPETEFDWMFHEACDGGAVEDPMYVMQAKNNLGVLYMDQNKNKEAMELFVSGALEGHQSSIQNLLALVQKQLERVGREDMFPDLVQTFSEGNVELFLEQMRSLENEPLSLSKGCCVVLHGLGSENGQKLNGKRGIVLGKVKSRIAVSVDGVSISVKKSNLKWAPLTDPSDIQIVSDSATASQSSSQETEGHVCDTNASIMNTLMHSSVPSKSISVVICEYSRNEQWFRKGLSTAPELAERRKAIVDAGFNIELGCGAKCFVTPQFFDIVENALIERGLELDKRHVIIDADMEHLLHQVVERNRQATPRSERGSFKLKGKSMADVNVATTSSSSPSSPSSSWMVHRTFIHIPIPSSLLSACSLAPATM
jgi:Flp pilus assembly protein TadD